MCLCARIEVNHYISAKNDMAIGQVQPMWSVYRYSREKVLKNKDFVKIRN